MSTAKRILLADDHPVMMAGLTSLIAALPGFTVVETCPDGETALQRIEALAPDIAVLDQNMPGATGVEVLARVTAYRWRTAVVLLTADIRDCDVMDAVDAGVSAIMLKTDAAGDLAACLTAVAAGRQWFPQRVEAAINRECTRRGAGRRLLDMLTEREIEIVRLAAQNMPNKTIAYTLGIAEGTVKIHLNSIYNKLEVHSRSGLMELAHRYFLR